ncbi:MAG: DUF4291 domain-containing protein [Anaerolineae bacterium]
MFTFETFPYLEQRAQWPEQGKHILAQYTESHIVVYQAYNREIGHFAAENGFFGNGFSLGRMTWIKPNFLWMMHRSGWATKENQEVILAIWLSVDAFDAILKKAVLSSFDPVVFADEAEWQRAVDVSSVRLQWDPDYTPAGERLERRAVQIGLRGKSVAHFAQGGWIEHIEDVTPFVHAQREHAKPPYTNLVLPREQVYTVYDANTVRRIGLTTL